MKKLLALVLASVMAFTVFCAFADTKITTTGTGEVRVSADTAIIMLGVNVRDKEVEKAQQKVNERIDAIMNALKSLGVAKECINTNYINLYAIYAMEDDQEQVQAYNASSSLSVKATDINRVGIIIDSAFAAGANTLDGITFSASNTKTAQEEALTKAVAAAKTKAKVLAAASGMKITGIDSVTEEGAYCSSNTVGDLFSDTVAEKEAPDAETVVQAAKVVVSETVKVVYEAESLTDD